MSNLLYGIGVVVALLVAALVIGYGVDKLSWWLFFAILSILLSGKR